MSTRTKIFIAILVVVLIVITIIVLKYVKTKTPSVESTQYTKETTGLAGVGGIGGIGGLLTGLGLSDERAKTKISYTGYGDAYNKIKVIKPMEYMFTRADGTRPCPECENKMRYGFSAQDLEKVDERLVFTDKNGVKYIDNHQLIALNTGAIQQVMSQQEQLMQMISAGQNSAGGAANGGKVM